MKKFMFAMMAMITIALSANAMSYSQAREQALFLTDKMAYELNLNDAQYEAAYEINLDYLMGINDYSDLYGVYWTRRNLDLSYILLDWQYRAYCAANYFYRPLYWDGGYWHFGIYARYPHRDYFYFGRPHFVAVYRGGHSWHQNGNRSWYRGRDFGGRINRDGGHEFGMRDRFDRGDYGRGTREFGGRSNQQANRQNNANRSFGSRVNQQQSSSNQSGSFGSRTNQQQSTGSYNGSNRSFGSRANSELRSSTRTTVERRSNESSSSFGSRANSTPNRTFSPSSSSRSNSGSFGGRTGGSSMGSRSSSGSFGGGHTSSGSSRTGGGSFGGGHR